MERCDEVTFVRGWQVQTLSWRPDILNDVSGEVYSLARQMPELYPILPRIVSFDVFSKSLSTGHINIWHYITLLMASLNTKIISKY